MEENAFKMFYTLNLKFQSSVHQIQIFIKKYDYMQLCLPVFDKLSFEIVTLDFGNLEMSGCGIWPSTA